MTAPPDTWTDVWDSVVGQPRAIEVLRAALDSPAHAYLLVGPHGSGKRAVALAFSAELLRAGRDDAERQAELALAEKHPDQLVVERVGASISSAQADFIIERANLTPVEGDRKVLILDEFHLVAENVGPKLLKTIEEPPAGTFFLVLADEVPPALVTIASRCVRVDLAPLSVEAIAERLRTEGVDGARADEAASASGGDLGRARVLATDDEVARRRDAWHGVPDQLDGSGAAAVLEVDALLALIEEAMAPLEARQADELRALDERVAAFGERGSGRRELTERHAREQRRYRTDEIRFGLLTLARRYREELVGSARPGPVLDALSVIDDLAGHLVRNPTLRLQLVALFLRLGRG